MPKNDETQTTGLQPKSTPPDWRDGVDPSGAQSSRNEGTRVRSPWNTDSPGWNGDKRPEPLNRGPTSPWTTTK